MAIFYIDPRFLQSDATTEARELLTELLEIAYSGRKTQEEALALLGAQISKTAGYIISVEVRALLHVRALDVINYVLYVYVRAQTDGCPICDVRLRSAYFVNALVSENSFTTRR